MRKKVRAAVLGLGRLGYWHAVNVVKNRHAQLAAVVDRDPAVAEKVAKELEVSRFSDNVDDIFQDDTIDAVLIVTPTSTHYELLKKASEAGKAIFVEKPLTIDLEEAYEIQRIIRENRIICQVGFMRRYDRAYREAKARIQAGDIGTPIYFRGISRDPEAPHESFIKYSGGIFVDVSIHDFDIARYLMGSEIRSVHAHGKILKYPFMEKYGDVDQGLTYVEFASGAAGDVEASRNAYYGYDIRAEIIGTEGSIFIGDLKRHSIHIMTKNRKSHDIWPDFPTRFQEAYKLEIDDFFRTVAENAIPTITVEDGVKALEIALAARSSFEKGRKIELS